MTAPSFFYPLKWHYTTKIKKKIIGMDPEILGHIFLGLELGPDFFLKRTNSLFLMYLFGTFHTTKFLVVLSQSHKNKLGPLASNNFFGKTNNISLTYLLVPFILQKWKRIITVQQILSYKNQSLLSPYWFQNSHFPKHKSPKKLLT